MNFSGESAIRTAKRLLTLKKQYSYSVSGKDRYGRSICVVKLDNTTFNEQMVLNGYAMPYRQYMNAIKLKHYNMLLEKAESKKVGLWRNRESVIKCLNRARF